MKMKKKDYEVLKSACVGALEGIDIQTIIKRALSTHDRYDIEWDLFYAVIEDTGLELYVYLDEAHIESVLKKIIGDHILRKLNLK